MTARAAKECVPCPLATFYYSPDVYCGHFWNGEDRVLTVDGGVGMTLLYAHLSQRVPRLQILFQVKHWTSLPLPVVHAAKWREPIKVLGCGHHTNFHVTFVRVAPRLVKLRNHQLVIRRREYFQEHRTSFSISLLTFSGGQPVIMFHVKHRFRDRSCAFVCHDVPTEATAESSKRSVR